MRVIDEHFALGVKNTLHSPGNAAGRRKPSADFFRAKPQSRGGAGGGKPVIHVKKPQKRGFYFVKLVEHIHYITKSVRCFFDVYGENVRRGFYSVGYARLF